MTDCLFACCLSDRERAIYSCSRLFSSFLHLAFSLCSRPTFTFPLMVSFTSFRKVMNLSLLHPPLSLFAKLLRLFVAQASSLTTFSIPSLSHSWVIVASFHRISDPHASCFVHRRAFSPQEFAHRLSFPCLFLSPSVRPRTSASCSFGFSSPFPASFPWMDDKYPRVLEAHFYPHLLCRYTVESFALLPCISTLIS